MAAPTLLTSEQKDTLLEWMSADYLTGLIRLWAAERGWPELSDQLLSYYRKQFSREIAGARRRRRNSALNRGLAVKEERVAQLVEHANELRAIMWIPDDHGRYANEKAWRETLDDIAKETGGRVNKTELAGTLKQSGAVKVIVQYADSAIDPTPDEYPDDGDGYSNGDVQDI